MSVLDSIVVFLIVCILLRKYSNNGAYICRLCNNLLFTLLVSTLMGHHQVLFLHTTCYCIVL
jgi:hypothetical protein